MSVKVDDRLGFEKDGPHHAMKKGITPYYYAGQLHCSFTALPIFTNKWAHQRRA